MIKLSFTYPVVVQEFPELDPEVFSDHVNEDEDENEDEELLIAQPVEEKKTLKDENDRWDKQGNLECTATQKLVR